MKDQVKKNCTFATNLFYVFLQLLLLWNIPIASRYNYIYPRFTISCPIVSLARGKFLIPLRSFTFILACAIIYASPIKQTDKETLFTTFGKHHLTFSRHRR